MDWESYRTDIEAIKLAVNECERLGVDKEELLSLIHIQMCIRDRLRIEDISVGVSKVIDVLKPILYGMVIAYLLNPIVKQIDRWLIPQLKKKMSQEKAKKVSRSVGVFAALVMLLALILALCNMLIPELYKMCIRDRVLMIWICR